MSCKDKLIAVSNPNEIREMIAATQAGDANRILDILGRLLVYTENVERIARDARRIAVDAADQNPFMGAR